MNTAAPASWPGARLSIIPEEREDAVVLGGVTVSTGLIAA
jgi:hypothetical protein